MPGKGEGAKDAQDLRVGSKKEAKKGSKKESKGAIGSQTKQSHDKAQAQTTADAPPAGRSSIPEGGQNESDSKQ